MNNTPKRKRALGTMIKASMSSYEIEMLVSAGKKMVDEEISALQREEGGSNAAKKH
ncbi:TPA: hypothetical protein O8L21_004506 [Enterobacter cloacae]|jgi:hypothetical protein|uniref:hypothetical protein n=1 Tax=Bacteria TaxID=2 RepID=UPI0007919F30|nr:MULTISPECIES: hypothetical protein [Enterobacteriaceae]EDV2006316.1 hypothetical protein [Salmonella enterica subsp. enterica serovar Oranienburg]EDZ0443510.1 hypothetical protein [Salmonella enterica]EEC3345786.1 hypothetical protein [Salmonella enterica subsp. enterica serovar Schwarzengrund]EGT3138647.1 hypothetical protein [Salmonella enterica subsp. enterica serovar Uganda]EKZ5446147.1 hypothetical protein [Klebsiella aerogenes]QMF90502.1 hypothetical protein HVY72_24475 [Citrobacter 